MSYTPRLTKFSIGLAVGFLLPATLPAGAQTDWGCGEEEGMAAWVEGTRVPLSRARSDRLPYGRDISILVRAATPAPRAVRVAYELAGGADGPRAGIHEAVARPGDPTCWAAAMPRIRLNESGRYEARLFRPAEFRMGHDPATFAAGYILGLARMPTGLGPEAFAEQVAIVARTEAGETFLTAPDELVVRIEDRTTPFLGHLSAMLVEGLETANILYTAQNNAMLLRQRLGMLGALDASLLDRGVTSCRVGETVGRLARTAAGIEEASLDDLARLVARGVLPWPTCALAVVAAAEPATGPDSDQAARYHRDAVRLTRELVGDPALHRLLDTTRRVEALGRMVTSVRTIDVPVGADLLERYTQLDVVMTYLPHSAYNLVQPFAAATWYFASAGAGHEYAASVAPSGDDRWGLQIGYPIGARAEAARREFEPTLLTGVIYRLNAVNSISAGAVTGRVTGDDRVRTDHVFFVSTNLDLSNLGPLQQLFARRDR